MMLIVYSPSTKTAIEIGVAATLAGIDVEHQPSVQGFCSRLYRDHDAIGLYYQTGWSVAVEIARELRGAGVPNLLFCVIEHQERGEERQSLARARILNAGADDVQNWPCDANEVSSRLAALSRRTHARSNLLPLAADAMFDPWNRRVLFRDLVVHLTGKETLLLECLTSRPGTCVSKDTCMLALYGQRDEAKPKIIDVFIHKLRRKLAPVWGDNDPIECVWGQGYRFAISEAAA